MSLASVALDPLSSFPVLLLLWVGWKVVRVVVRVRVGWEHCSQGGGAETPAHSPIPSSSSLRALSGQTPNHQCWSVKHLLFPGVREGAGLPPDLVWGSGPRKSGWAGKESGSDGHQHAWACPRSTPNVLAGRLLRGSLGDRSEGTQWQFLCMTAL